MAKNKQYTYSGRGKHTHSLYENQSYHDMKISASCLKRLQENKVELIVQTPLGHRIRRIKKKSFERRYAMNIHLV